MTGAIDRTGALLRVVAIIALPLVVGITVIALYSLLAGILDPWWFRTDACPDPAMTCGQFPPVTFLVAGVVFVGVGVAGRAYRWVSDQ